ncbi:MAG: hypothetical protein IPP49_11440 [Saprospiraceae bacterium]|nr:hypothetical protein [Saprospiraceae bacterium]
MTRGSAVRVPIVTGIKDTFNAQFLTSEKASKKRCFNIMQYVSKDDFLTALIEQVHVEQDSIGILY